MLALNPSDTKVTDDGLITFTLCVCYLSGFIALLCVGDCLETDGVFVSDWSSWINLFDLVEEQKYDVKWARGCTACENVSDRVSGATVWVNARVSLPTRELLLVTQFPSPSGYQAHYRYTHGWPGGKHHEESALVGGGLPEHLSCPGQQQLNSFPWSMVFWAMTAICILIFVPQFYLFLCTTSLLQVLGHHLICRL